MKRSASFLAGLFVITFALAFTVAAAPSARETLSREALNVSAWALAGLDENVSPDIRRNLSYLREDLLDEGKSAAQASAASYKLGCDLCNALIAALDERNETSVRAGYRAAQANANTRITSPDLEVRRNYSMSWPQYAREQSQRAEIQRQQNNQTALAREVVRGEWASRVATLRRNLDELYKRYRDALRQDHGFQMSSTSDFNRVVPDGGMSAPQPLKTPIGFQPLFNGRDLTGWTPMEDDDTRSRPSSGGWQARNGELLCVTGPDGWLRSDRQYRDFILQLEFKLCSKGNSGICIRSPDSGLKSTVAATEIQIVDPSVLGRKKLSNDML